MFFSILMPSNATTQDEVSFYFNKQILLVSGFLFGFLALASYLALPA